MFLYTGVRGERSNSKKEVKWILRLKLDQEGIDLEFRNELLRKKIKMLMRNKPQGECQLWKNPNMNIISDK